MVRPRTARARDLGVYCTWEGRFLARHLHIGLYVSLVSAFTANFGILTVAAREGHLPF